MQNRWHGYLGGNPGNNPAGTISFMMEDGKQPNWFHRLMQHWVLGIYWRRESR